MDFLKNAIGIGELALGRDIVDEAEFVAGLDQAAEGVLRGLQTTSIWRKSFGTGREREANIRKPILAVQFLLVAFPLTAQTGTVKLAWDSNLPEQQVTKYTVYRAPEATGP